MQAITIERAGIESVELHANRWAGGSIQFKTPDEHTFPALSTNWIGKARRLLTERGWPVVEV